MNLALMDKLHFLVVWHRADKPLSVSDRKFLERVMNDAGISPTMQTLGEEVIYVFKKLQPHFEKVYQENIEPRFLASAASQINRYVVTLAPNFAIEMHADPQRVALLVNSLAIGKGKLARAFHAYLTEACNSVIKYVDQNMGAVKAWSGELERARASGVRVNGEVVYGTKAVRARIKRKLSAKEAAAA